MSGFECPGCKCVSQIFPATSGGADLMCEEMDTPLLGKIPMDPRLLESCESGKCYVAEYPDTRTAEAINNIVKKIKENAGIEETTPMEK